MSVLILANMQSGRPASKPFGAKARRVSRILAATGLFAALAGCAAPPPSDADLSAALSTVDTAKPKPAGAPNASSKSLQAKARALSAASREPAGDSSDIDPAMLALRAGAMRSARNEATGPSDAPPQDMPPEEIMRRLKSLSSDARRQSMPDAAPADARSLAPVQDADVVDPDKIMRRLKELSASQKVAQALPASADAPGPDQRAPSAQSAASVAKFSGRIGPPPAPSSGPAASNPSIYGTLSLPASTPTATLLANPTLAGAAL